MDMRFLAPITVVQSAVATSLLLLLAPITAVHDFNSGSTRRTKSSTRPQGRRGLRSAGEAPTSV
jgi:hypothetical protein